MPNRFQPIQPGTDNAQLISTLNANFAQLDQENTIKAFYDANGNPNLLMGQIGDGLQGIIMKNTAGLPRIGMFIDTAGEPQLKVSKPFYDVTTATDAQLQFNSSWETPQIIQKYTATRTRAASAAAITDTVTTGLKYAPPYLAYLTTYINGAGQPTETGMVGVGGSFAGSADFQIFGQLAGADGYMTLTYPANGTLSVVDFTFTIYLLTDTIST